MRPVRRRSLEVHRADAVEYGRALDWQMATAEAVRAGRATDGGGEAVALIQHTPVYTMGARGGRRSLLVAPESLTARGAEVLDCDRGGDITFHGPGQLVAYPILDLHARGLHAGPYVRALEQCVLRTLSAFGVQGERVTGRPGVWASPARSADREQPAKVAAIGVRIERGVSRHGLALNVSTDLAWFDAIVPCGIPDAGVTSLESFLGEGLGRAPAFEDVVKAFRGAFAEVFECELVEAAQSPFVEEGVTA
jgi:lipoyl(octanoyl) transferase